MQHAERGVPPTGLAPSPPGVGSGRASPSKPRPRLAGPTVHSLSAASINFKVSIRESARKLAGLRGSGFARATRTGPAPPLARLRDHPPVAGGGPTARTPSRDGSKRDSRPDRGTGTSRDARRPRLAVKAQPCGPLGALGSHGDALRSPVASSGCRLALRGPERASGLARPLPSRSVALRGHRGARRAEHAASRARTVRRAAEGERREPAPHAELRGWPLRCATAARLESPVGAAPARVDTASLPLAGAGAALGGAGSRQRAAVFITIYELR